MKFKSKPNYKDFKEKSKGIANQRPTDIYLNRLKRMNEFYNKTLFISILNIAKKKIRFLANIQSCRRKKSRDVQKMK